LSDNITNINAGRESKMEVGKYYLTEHGDTIFVLKLGDGAAFVDILRDHGWDSEWVSLSELGECDSKYVPFSQPSDTIVETVKE
jgi:hypothetical protein